MTASAQVEMVLEPPVREPVDAAMNRLVRETLATTPGVRSIVVGDRHGLPIVGVVRAPLPVMTLTAIAAMAAQAAENAAGEVALSPPLRVLVETEKGTIVLVPLPSGEAYVIAIFATSADVRTAVAPLERLAVRIADMLRSM